MESRRLEIDGREGMMNEWKLGFTLVHSLTQKPLQRQAECGVNGTVQRHVAEGVVDGEYVVDQRWVVEV